VFSACTPKIPVQSYQAIFKKFEAD